MVITYLQKMYHGQLIPALRSFDVHTEITRFVSIFCKIPLSHLLYYSSSGRTPQAPSSEQCRMIYESVLLQIFIGVRMPVTVLVIFYTPYMQRFRVMEDLGRNKLEDFS